MYQRREIGRVSWSVLTVLAALGATAAVPADINDVRLKGYVGERLDACLRHHVQETDVTYLTDCFFDRTETHFIWQTEFWGKYMHSAMPFAGYTQCPRLRAAIDAGLDRVLSAQTPEGYIGNYPDDLRCNQGWDVWGMKYTLLGLLHYYDGAKGTPRGEQALAAAKRLCDFVIREIGPGGKREFWTTGNYAGMPSCSILEPVVWLYRRTGDEKYLNFAGHIVEQMSVPVQGPRLLDLALKDVPVYLRWPIEGDVKPSRNVERESRLKAYEMMSCYQGLLEYYEVTGRRDCLEAAVKTAVSIVRDEINVAGGAASSEHWYHGAERQHQPWKHQQETCVTITWMRLCEKLLALTGESRWADEIEKSFYNAYLAAMRRDGGEFAAYTPLNGSRLAGHDHCRMHTNCCNANGPRGFLVFLRAFLMAEEKAAVLNFYSSGRSAVMLPGLGEKVVFDQYTHYPRTSEVQIWNRTAKPLDFTLKLRIPAWSAQTSVKVNGHSVEGVKAGDYLVLARRWLPGDEIDIGFDLSAKAHRLDGAVAFTRGPVVMARDTRLGDVGEVLRPWLPKNLDFTLVRNESPDVWITCTAKLPFGSHDENPNAWYPAGVTFVDYASAGNDWTPRNSVRAWFNLERVIPHGW